MHTVRFNSIILYAFLLLALFYCVYFCIVAHCAYGKCCLQAKFSIYRNEKSSSFETSHHKHTPTLKSVEILYIIYISTHILPLKHNAIRVRAQRSLVCRLYLYTHTTHFITLHTKHIPIRMSTVCCLPNYYTNVYAFHRFHFTNNCPHNYDLTQIAESLITSAYTQSCTYYISIVCRGDLPFYFV